MYWRAWEALRHDRQYGALGGETPISYIAISRFAQDNEIPPADFTLFHRFMTAIDAEWLDHVARETELRKKKGG
ncbi:hypothetical protein [Mesorhizobium sp. YM1C-6-2]|uniref:hypothetical protein n=1 Tax=Mesorhizobium sp. YM1C-6-2 TaxID=1827501 RepID=UPI000EF182F2|nr:hypothetical protein [Mesorhizobium sp. YM1C-6-2]RLP22268.1 hypothetical protein D8676_25345 [Mesorhizobium sp. YM1C-6-2]